MISFCSTLRLADIHFTSLVVCVIRLVYFCLMVDIYTQEYMNIFFCFVSFQLPQINIICLLCLNCSSFSFIFEMILVQHLQCFFSQQSALGWRGARKVSAENTPRRQAVTHLLRAHYAHDCGAPVSSKCVFIIHTQQIFSITVNWLW